MMSAVPMSHGLMVAALMFALGFAGVMRPISTSCVDHMGASWARIHTWDGKAWKAVTPNWVVGDKAMIRKMQEESAAKYAAVWTPEGSPLLAIGRRQQAGLVKINRPLAGGQLAFQVAGAGIVAKSHGGGVTLVGVQQVGRKLGGFAQAHRQQAGGQRVEHAGVAGFFGVVVPARGLQRLVAGHAQRLVQQQHAMNRPLGRLGQSAYSH